MITNIIYGNSFLEHKERCFENLTIKISDQFSSKRLFCGKIVSEKVTTGLNRCFFISPDNRFFFNVNSKAFRIEVTSDQSEQFDDSGLSEKYTFMKWVDFHYKVDVEKQENLLQSVDIVRDYSYDEIDQPVYNLCHAINDRFNGSCVTVSSCCGHNSAPLWVACQFFSLDSLTKMMNILNSSNEFRENFQLHSSIHFSYVELQNPILQISTYKKGKEAYILAEKLAVYIQSVN